MIEAGKSRSQHGQRNKTWQHTPRLPVQTSPYFRWPPDPRKIVRWIAGSWFPLSERLIILAISIVSWAFLRPSLDQCREFQVGWVAQIYLQNLGLMILIAGGLHLYFYVWRRQGDELRYDARPFPANDRKFTFRSQVWDNMFWTLASGVTIWTAYEVLMLWAMANGYAPALTLPEHLPWLILMIFLLPVWETIYFFLIHRLIHWSPLYRHVHSLHHRNTNVGPWSGMSMHPAEHIIYLGTVLIHFVVPANPLLIIFHLQYFTLSAVTTHTGYQGITLRGRLILPLGTFHHQLHHRYFTCNYGGLEIPVDQWTGSFHDGTEESHQQFMENRRRKVHA